MEFKEELFKMRDSSIFICLGMSKTIESGDNGVKSLSMWRRRNPEQR